MTNQIYWFGIGFNRSGTLSLTEYFRSLNIPAVHWKNGEISKQIKHNYNSNVPLLTNLENWRAFFDMEHFDLDQPLGYYKSYQKHYKQLEQQYPNAIFIFNKRPCGEWIKSLFNHPVYCDEITTLEYIKKVSKLSVYQIVKALENEYNCHYKDVLNYFKDKPDKLIIFDLENISQSRAILEASLNKYYSADIGVGVGAGVGAGFVSFPKVNQGKRKKISFMICCMSRTNHLEQTLEKNILDNLEDRGDIELVVVHFLHDLNKSNDLKFENLIHTKYKSYLQDRYLKYFQNSDFNDKNWKAGACRYTAFWYTSGDLVYNLDCDNFIGLRGARVIINNFSKYGNHSLIFLGFNGVYADGSFGRICLSERNHFLINSYDYNLPTIWSHDDSLLLMKGLLQLGLTLLLPSLEALEYLKRLLIGIGFSNSLALKIVDKIEIIVDKNIIPHSGISHSRTESFKTVNYSNNEQIINNDLQTGYLYLASQLPNINELLDRLGMDKKIYNMIGDNMVGDNMVGDNMIYNSKVFYSLENYFKAMLHCKIIYYVDYCEDSKEVWKNIQTLVKSTREASSINRPITIVSNLELYQKHKLDYRGSDVEDNNVIWLIDNEGLCTLESKLNRNLDYQFILIKLNYNIKILNPTLSTKIVKLLNEYQSNFILDSNKLLSVKKYDNLSKCDNNCIFYDFLQNSDICYQSNLNLKNLSDWSLVVWGDPVDYGNLKIGDLEKSRRRDVLQNSNNFIDFCQSAGVVITKITDKQNFNIQIGKWSRKTIILTYGLFCYNTKIPILPNIKYLIWQPDNSFKIDYFPINHTVVAAYCKKTHYNTFLLDKADSYDFSRLLFFIID